jgi:hypothetical protein
LFYLSVESTAVNTQQLAATAAGMPTFLLYIKADLENIRKIDVPLGHSFCIDVSSTFFTLPDSQLM